MQAPSKQFFYNYVLGTPYQDDSYSIKEPDIISNRRDYLEGDLPNRGDYAFISAGIDWGEHFHHIVFKGVKANGQVDNIRLARVRTSVGAEHIEEDLREVIGILENYDPDIILPDIGFNGNYVDRLIKHFGGDIVFGVNVRSARSNGDPNPQFNVNKSQVTIDKLTQNVIEMTNIKSGRIGFPKAMNQNMQLFIKHWGNVVIRDEEDDNTGLPYKSITRRDDDHFAQSDVYAMVGVNYLTKLVQENSGDAILASYIGDNSNDDSHLTPLQRALNSRL